MAYRKNFYEKMKLLKEQIISVRDREQAEIWSEIEQILIEGNYKSYRKSRNFVELCMEGYSDFTIASKLNISEVTVRIHKHDLSNELYSIFGDDFFILFEDYAKNKLNIKKRVLIASQRLSDGRDFLVKSLPIELIGLIKTKISTADTANDFKLSDCRKEVNFLERHCSEAIRKELADLDANKLAYVMNIIESEEGFTDDKYKVYAKLKGWEL